ncbi:MAG: hypothetical protein ACRDPK_15495 [Carbonactinosporaceae bacterium]
MAGAGPAQHERFDGARGPRRPVVALALLGLAWAVVTTGFGSFSWSARAATAAAVATVLVLAARRDSAAPRLSWRTWLARGSEQVREPPRRRALTAWGLLIVLAAAWELLSLFGGPRSQHPTLSSIVEDLQSNRGVDTLIRAVWLGLGAWLVRR